MIETNFKHTDIGLIPHDWEVKTLGDLLSICNGRDYKHLSQGSIPVYGTGGIIAMVNDYLYDGETICIGRKGTIDKPQYHKGKIWTVDTLFYTKNFFANPLFLYFKSQTINWHAINEATGVPSLTSKNIAKVQIPLPPTLAEQEKIADALSKTDKLINDLGALIEKKKAIKQGTMQDLLTAKRRLKGFTGEWVEVRLGDVAKLKSGYAFKSTTYSNIGTFKIITIANVQNGVLDMSDYNKIVEIPSNIQEHQILKEGDILVSMTGNVGRVCRVDCKNCLLNQRVGVFALKNTIDAEYLYVILNNLEFEKEMIGKGHGAAQPNIGSSDVESYCFVVPPTIVEQRAIAAVLSGMDTEIAALEQKRDKYIAIKSGMMQDLLTGKIRLV